MSEAINIKAGRMPIAIVNVPAIQLMSDVCEAAELWLAHGKDRNDKHGKRLSLAVDNMKRFEAEI